MISTVLQLELLQTLFTRQYEYISDRLWLNLGIQLVTWRLLVGTECLIRVGIPGLPCLLINEYYIILSTNYVDFIKFYMIVLLNYYNHGYCYWFCTVIVFVANNIIVSVTVIVNILLALSHHYHYWYHTVILNVRVITTVIDNIV